MRDKNLTFEKFNIQLEKAVNRIFPKSDSSLRIPVSDAPTRRSPQLELRVIFPKDFRLLRTLAIAQWYFPDLKHWIVYLDLSEQNFHWLNEKQQIELQILLSSKDMCESYLFLTERYTGSEIFGNILGNDLVDLQRHLKFRKVVPKVPKRKIRRRGYRDHGTLRPSHLWLETYDYTFTSEHFRRKRHLELLQTTIQKILSKLRELTQELSKDR